VRTGATRYDQGWDFFSDVVVQVREAHAIDRVIINVFPNTSYSDLQKRVGEIPEDATLMIVVNMARPDAESIIQSYDVYKRSIVQCLFPDDQLPSVQDISGYRQHLPIWINSLWPDQNGNHDDDAALITVPPIRLGVGSLLVALLCFRPTGRESLWNIFARTTQVVHKRGRCRRRNLTPARRRRAEAVSEMWVQGKTKAVLLRDFQA
jgi:hypothetical protein